MLENQPLAVLPRFLKDQQTPPEVSEIVALHRDNFSKCDITVLEEEFKLRWYYGGHSIVATPTKNGLQIHAVDLDDPKLLYDLRIRLRGEGHITVLSLYPAPWNWQPELRLLTSLPAG